MAKSMNRGAAGVAAVLAIFLAGGPGTAVTYADPGGSRSPSGSSRDGGHSRGNPGGNSDNRGGSSQGGDRRGGDKNSNDRRGDDQRGGDRSGGGYGSGNGPGNGSRGGGAWGHGGDGRDGRDGRDGDGRGGYGRGGDGRGGYGRGGDGRGDGQGSSGRGSTSSRGDGGQATVSTAQTATASRSVAAVQSESVTGTSSTSSTSSTSTPTTPSSPDVPAVLVGSGGGGAVPGQATVPFTAPIVTFGDGRSPAFLAETPAELPGQPTPRPLIKQAQSTPAAVAAPAPRSALEPLPVAGPPMTVESVPWPLSETPVTSFWGRVEPGWPAGLLFGLAGLLLAPIGGVWLGWRQARATRAASQLVS